MSEHQRPVLSVVVTTWNNEKFIGTCLKSILEQTVDFEIEILVGNDGSTDKTADIVRSFEKDNPKKIKFYDRPQNVGTSRNFIDLVYKCSGEFIAQVDGDDRLTDPTKFQRQVDFLRLNPQCSICFHHYSNHSADGSELPASSTPFNEDTTTDLNLLLRTTMGPGNTTVFRRNALPQPPPDWIWKCGNHKDFAIQFLVASVGKIGYIHRVMSAYTIHETNITKIEPVELLLKNSILINEGFIDYHKKLGITDYLSILKSVVNHRLLRLSFFYLDSGRYFKFIQTFINATILHNSWNLKMVKDALHEVSPELFYRLKSIFSLSKS